MLQAIDNFFQTKGLMPHGLCLLWKPAVLWTIVVSNALTALAYFSIPVALLYFIYRRQDLKFRWIFALFGAFILACGMTHVMGIVTLWIPVYGWQAFILAITAIVSVLTAILIWPQIPLMLKIPAPWQLQDANKRLAEKMQTLETLNKELEQFAYVASHDLKAPLRGVANLSSWIVEDDNNQLSKDSAKHLENIKNRIQKMNGLIEGILEYARIGKIENTNIQCDLNQLIHELKSTLSINDQFKIIIKNPLPTVKAPETVISQIFTNLISNAIKHHHKSSGKIILSAQNTDKAHVIIFEDDGPGIPAKYHDKVFEIFQTLEAPKNADSTGLGLAIVKKCVTYLNGTIKLESSKTGTRFVITFPKGL